MKIKGLNLWLPVMSMVIGILLMLITSLAANSSQRIASWPSVTIGPIHLIFFGEDNTE